MLKVSTKFQPNTNNQFEYEVFGQLSESQQDQLFFSSINNSIDQYETVAPFSVSQNLNYYYTLDEKNIFAVEAQHVFKDEDPFYNAVLEDKLSYDETAENLGLDQNQSNYNINQDKRVISNQTDAKIDYWYILNKKSNLNFTLGTILSQQKFDSNIFQFLDNGSQLDTSPTMGEELDKNVIDYNFYDIYLGLHYRLKAGIFTLTPGLSGHIYNVNNTQFGLKATDNFVRLLPDLNIIVQLKKSETLNFNYRMQTQFTDVANFASGLVLNNYNAIFTGNPYLENALSHNLSLFYYSFNMFNYTNVFASLNYNKSIDNIRTQSVFQPGTVIRVSTPFNSPFADESFNARGRFQRTFGKIRGTINANFNYSKFNQFIQNRQSLNEVFSQTYRAQLRTNFRTAPNIDLSYRYSIQDNNLGQNNTKFFTKSPNVEIDALFLKSFTFKTDYSFNDFSDENGTINTFEFWNASLSYRKDEDSKFEYQLRATNLLDTRSQNQSNAGNIAVSATEYFIQPRFITLQIRYEL